MKRFIPTVLITLLCFSGIAQVKFTDGYYIDNSGLKNNCLIRDLDWGINPRSFNYKSSPLSDSKTMPIDSAKEFGITGGARYVRYVVDMEKVEANPKLLNHSKNLVLEKVTLFLKVLIDGNASLFVYREDQNTFFFKTETSKITQIIYKQYLVGYNGIAKNIDYKQQLLNNLKCEALAQSDFENLNYDTKSLTSIFKKFNSCGNNTYVDYENKIKKDLFNLNVKTGVNYSSLEVISSIENNDIADFGSKASLKLGLEAEMILGFGNNKWALPIAVNYEYFKGTANTKSNMIAEVDLKTIGTSVGLRYYMFLNDNSKLFVNGSANYVQIFDSKIAYLPNKSLQFRSSINPTFGFGYKLLNKYIVEFNYDLNKNLLLARLDKFTKLHTLGLTLGYTLF